jgi:hypothetical protein
MSTPVRLALFAAGLAAVFGLAVGAGSLVGPVGAAAADEPMAGHGSAAAEGAPGDAGHDAPAAIPVPKGLQTTQDGYTLALDRPSLPAGPETELLFRVLDPHGQPLTDLEPSHDEDLHLIAVRRDLTGFQHVHPEPSPGGTWRTTLALTPGEWRVFADFVPSGGEGLTLGTDLSVAGRYSPAPLPAASRTAEVDGYTVTLTGDLVAGEESELTLSVTRNGRPVTDLQPYLAAYGHLVVLRDGDLAYLHVHPTGAPGDGRTQPGPDVRFATTAPSPGSYRLFLDFRHGDTVRTAEFTAVAGPRED